jgi:peptidoglycan L-alanyl-D-glutamate endopeptidase CwlK
MPRFSDASLNNLETCDHHLIHIFEIVVEHFDCTVLEGHRSRERQAELYEAGATRVKWSKHNHSPSLAVDVAPCPINWSDTERFYMFGGYVLGIADMLHIPIRWGGDWDGDRDVHDQDFMDLVHFELLLTDHSVKTVGPGVVSS